MLLRPLAPSVKTGNASFGKQITGVAMVDGKSTALLQPKKPSIEADGYIFVAGVNITIPGRIPEG